MIGVADTIPGQTVGGHSSSPPGGCHPRFKG
jgi:hypothetical protein